MFRRIAFQLQSRLMLLLVQFAPPSDATTATNWRWREPEKLKYLAIVDSSPVCGVVR
jgi:hypothetical protein